MNEIISYILEGIAAKTLDKKRANQLLSEYSHLRSGRSLDDRAQALHPLLHENVSDLTTQRFQSFFSGTEFFLRDHEVMGSSLLPGVASLEMALEAGRRALGVERVGVYSTHWLRPLVCGDDGVKVVIELGVLENGKIGFDVVTGEGESAIVHVQGELREFADVEQDTVDLVALESRCKHRIEGKDCYAIFAQRGLVYGPGHQSIAHLFAGDSEVLVKLDIPASVGQSAQQFALHPSVLDGALQASAGMDLDKDVDAQNIYLPFSLQQAELLDETCECVVWAYLRHSNDHRENSAERCLDIDLLSDTGVVLARLHGFRSREVSTRDLIQDQEASQSSTSKPDGASAQDKDRVLLAPSWEPVEPDYDKQWPVVTDKVLVLSDHPEFHSGLSQTYAQCEFLQTTEIEAVRQALAEMGSVDHIMWVVPTGQGTDPASLELLEDQERGVLFGFALLKAVLELGWQNKKLGWTIVTTEAISVSGTFVRPGMASVHGLIGSMAKELPNWKVRLIDVDSGAAIPWTSVLKLPSNNKGEALVRRAGEWRERQLVEVDCDSLVDWRGRQSGVYVVIGGAGGIGEVWTEHMITSCSAQIVWIGRRAQDSEIEASQDRLADLGPRPLYISADARDFDELSHAYAQIRSRFGEVHGVVHSALVLKDQALSSMTLNDFKTSLSVKVDVSVAIAKVFDLNNLDFVLYFSSMQSFSMSPGQSNYAAGCAFADAHADLLRINSSAAVKVMNWGYWGSVGSVAEKKYRESMARSGIGSIEREDGLVALGHLMTAGSEQLAYLRFTSARQIAGLFDKRLALDEHFPALVEPLELHLRQTLQVPSEDTDSEAVLLLGKAMETAMLRVIMAQLGELGLNAQAGALEREAIANHLKIVPQYQAWLHESIRRLVEEGALFCDGPSVTVLASEQLSLEQVWLAWENESGTWKTEPSTAAICALATETLRQLPAILTGATPATSVMFPKGSMDLVEGVYKGNPAIDLFNGFVAEVAASFVALLLDRAPEHNVRLLEVGAGTGGTSAAVFDRLSDVKTSIAEYAYTDLSRAFLQHAESNYAEKAPYLNTYILNLESPFDSQGIKAGQYDVVIATNVLHATKNIRQTLRHIKWSLARNGILIINEVVSNHLSTHATFGLLEGWWRFDDPSLRVSGSPLLSLHMWKSLLLQEGFSGAFQVSSEESEQQVIVAASNGVVDVSDGCAVKESKEPTDRSLAPPAHESSAELPVVSEDPDNRLVEMALSYTTAVFAKVLHLSTAEIDPDESFQVYGLDSITVMNMIELLNRDFSTLEPAVFFEHTTIRSLSDYLVKSYPDVISKFLGDTPTVKSDRVVVESAALMADATVSEIGTRRFSRYGQSELQQAKAAVLPVAGVARMDIAIVGLSGRYPQARTLSEFWSLLRAGTNAVSEVPASRWDWREYWSEKRGEAGKIYSRWGGFIDGVDEFDPLFFRISPKEAEAMDPQERLFLQTAYGCLEDAGYGGAVSGQVGVFAGVMNADYATGARYWSIANRVSYYLDLSGPSMVVDTACSSSLTAIHLACESLRRGESTAALAGGVNLALDPVHYMGMSAMTMLSSGDECRAFGEGADGFVDGEGVGAVLLKPLSVAEADGDHIYGVIRGSAMNHGGRTNGYTVPSPVRQGEVVAQALKVAGVEGREINYVEAHGTGTSLGDPIEIAGLTRAFGIDTSEDVTCAIGSVKSNIGHCESAAGIAGLTKVLLQMEHGELVPSLHSEKLNPHIDFEATPFRVQQGLSDWERPAGGKRLAGLSSFGAGGSNVHLVVEEYVGAERSVAEESGPYVYVLSARTELQLRERAEQFVGASEAGDFEGYGSSDVAYTLQVGREGLEYRLGFSGAGTEEFVRALKVWLSGEIDPSLTVYTGQAKSGKQATSVFAHDDDLQEAIARWVARGKTDKLLSLWVQGLVFDWSQLHEGAKPQRVSLPTYPFARESYWVSGVSRVAVSQPGVKTRLHPLLQENVSDLTVQRFVSRFSGEEFFLADHEVMGARVLPGVSYLEMAREAGRRALGVDRVGVYNTHWLRPVVCGDEGIEVSIELGTLEDGRIGFDVLTGEGDTSVVHAQGELRALSEALAASVDVEALQARCGHRVEGEDCYGVFAELGLVYGPGHRSVDYLQVGDSEVLARLSVPSSVLGSAGEYGLHPGVLDGALQASAGLDIGKDETGAGLYLPFALAEAELLGETSASAVWAHVRHAAGGSGAAAERVLDIDLLTDAGDVLVRLGGFSSRLVESSISKTTTSDNVTRIAEKAVEKW